MNCIRCGAEMNSTTGGNHTCPKCSMEVNDVVYRPQNCDMPKEKLEEEQFRSGIGLLGLGR